MPHRLNDKKDSKEAPGPARTLSLVLVLDRDGVISLCHSETETALGYPAAELVGASARRFFLPQAAPQGEPQRPDAGQAYACGWEAILEQAGHSGNWSGSCSLVRKDGSQLPVQLSITALLDGKGELSGYLVSANGDSGRQGDGRDLIQCRERLNAALEAIPHPVYLIDHDGILIHCNAHFAAFLGVSRAEIIGLRPSELESTEPAFLSALAQAEADCRCGP